MPLLEEVVAPSGQSSPDGQAYNLVPAVKELQAAVEVLAGLDAGELDVLDGVVAGVATADKAAVLGDDKELDEVHAGALFLGAGAGTEVTATADELNALDGITATVDELNALDGITATVDELNLLDGAGAVLPSAAVAAAHIADPAGGGTVDAESRTAIEAILDALEAFGIVLPA